MPTRRISLDGMREHTLDVYTVPHEDYRCDFLPGAGERRAITARFEGLLRADYGDLTRLRMTTKVDPEPITRPTKTNKPPCSRVGPPPPLPTGQCSVPEPKVI
ncbi:MAG TPA: hypothetical protein VNG71_02540 [Pyrinomonadaceae bacterium]|nr:hypothetical protein [Pyrinomonadaceae bacterium]